MKVKEMYRMALMAVVTALLVATVPVSHITMSFLKNILHHEMRF